MNPCSKIRRLTRSDARKNKMPLDWDWASLDQDLVELIGWRVLTGGDLQDYIRFRAVCSHWRGSTACPRGRGVTDPRFHPRRWMMLPEGHGLYPGHPDLRGFVRFFNLSTGALVRVHLPLLNEHVIIDSFDGLLLLHRDHDTAIRLLHPFTGDIAEFPPLASLLPQVDPEGQLYSQRNKRSRIMKVCSSITVSSTGAITAMLALDLLHRVAYATAGDQRWALSAWELKPFLKPIPLQGKLYALHYPSYDTWKVYIYQFNPPCPDPNGGLSHLPLPVKMAECSLDKFLYIVNFVQCGSELFLVAYNDASRSKLLVYRLVDLVNGKIEPVTTIGDHTLFVDERCLCVSHSPNKASKSFPSISPNSIICLRAFQDKAGFEGPARFEQYDLGTGIWTPASDGDIFESPPPSPHTLIHHIFTCCGLRYWNKGIMYCCQTKTTWLVKQDQRFGA